jgi:hypothetical protein
MAWRISGVGRVTVSLRKSTTGETTGCVSSVEAGVEAAVEAGVEAAVEAKVEAGVKEVVEDVRGAEYAGMTCTPLESIADRFSYPRFTTPFHNPVSNARRAVGRRDGERARAIFSYGAHGEEVVVGGNALQHRLPGRGDHLVDRPARIGGIAP